MAVTRSSTYRTKDGRYIALGGVEHKFVVNMLQALGRPDLIPAATGPNGPAQMPVKAALADAFLKRTRDEWEVFFKGLDVCAAPVLDLHEAFHSSQASAREMLVRDEFGNLHIGTPLKFADEPAQLRLELPRLGEHSEQMVAPLDD